MKRLLLIAAVALFAFSCSKKEADVKNDLYGTRWTLRIDSQNLMSLNFSDNTNMVLTGKLSGESMNAKGTYMYSKPNVSIKVIDEGETLNMNGTVTGNVMTLTFYAGGDEFEGNFTKE